MQGEEGARGTRPSAPVQPLGHLSHLQLALAEAHDVDEISRHLLTDLSAVPGVCRVGLALSEGGGRRLRFTASDRLQGDELDWCHIDAYDDVPLTRAVRTGEMLMSRVDELDPAYAEFAERQADPICGIAAVALPAAGTPLGGLIVYVDGSWGLTEGERGLLEATARRAAEALSRVRVGGDHARDTPDLSHDPAVRSAYLQLDDDPRSARIARHFLRGFLDEHGVDEAVADAAQLCLSEVVTNAVVHAAGATDVTALLDGVLTVTVRDRHARGGPAPGATVDEDPLRVHGRGLELVDALADRWGSERDLVGTTFWFVLDPDRPTGFTTDLTA